MTTHSKTLALLATLAITACATEESQRYIGTTEDDRAVEIEIDGDVLTAEIGTEQFIGTLSLDAELSLEMFDLESGGAKLDGIVVDRVVGAITDARGERVLFSAEEPDGFGQVSQADTTFTNTSQQYCACSTVYHRVYCRRIDGSWYWNGSYC